MTKLFTHISSFIVIFHLINVFIFASIEVDFSWDFTDGTLDGWASATVEEMNMDVIIANGELRGTIVGYNPTLDSPVLSIETGNRHYAVLRLMYYGVSVRARLLLKYGPQPNAGQNKGFSSAFWLTSFNVKAFSDSSSTNLTDISYATDGNLYTMWSSNTSQSSWIVLDLSGYRWITGLKIWSSGDGRSPKRCLIQKSLSIRGVGPFQTVASMTLQANTSDVQHITGFEGYGRYWRFVMMDNYGDESSIAIRDFTLEGYHEVISMVPFDLDNTGKFKNYYLPISDYGQGALIRMRLELVNNIKAQASPRLSKPAVKEALSLDYIRIVRAPDIWRVRGCIDKYYDSPNMFTPKYNVTSITNMINNHLPLRSYIQNTMTLKYATTFDCPLQGGVNITIEGLNLASTARVYIGGKECTVLSVTGAPEGGFAQSIICTLPAGVPGPATLRVQNGILPGIFQEVSFISYREAAIRPDAPFVTNIAARKVDLVWKPPGDSIDHLMITGYRIIWSRPEYRSRVSNMTVGNVTTTSVRGLQPGTKYVFAIAALTEGGYNEQAAVLPTDLYGRRDATSTAIVSGYSPYSEITGTLQHDFYFQLFNANSTLNSSGGASTTSSNGPTGMYGAEGGYGLYVVGSAHIENCNSSITCCDGYNSTVGYSSCGTGATVCAGLLDHLLEYDYAIDGVSRRQVPSNTPYADGGLPEKVVLTFEELVKIKGATLPTLACGPSLRLTPSQARESGSVWYRRKQNVREGFDTTISFEISNPSLVCDRLHDVNTRCRSRGADGLAFVLQDVSPTALGRAGSGLGYEGIFNALAVEVDTYFNYDNLDYYENHISVLTQGWRYNLSANHSYSLATTTRIPDLTDGSHKLRIRYDPNFDSRAVTHPSFQTSGFTSWFIENADFAYGGEGDWGVGFGLLYIYLDDLYSPVITTPLNLGATLTLDDGRCYVGVTAATGDSHWQAHDLLDWSFSSLYIDESYTPPLVANGEGAHECVNTTACVHASEFSHYTRTSNSWGKGQDSTESWQTGTEGFCSAC